MAEWMRSLIFFGYVAAIQALVMCGHMSVASSPDVLSSVSWSR